MLTSWLDENLPRVVERMVQAEIERVTRVQFLPNKPA
jgi:cell pole-organizing protein PopZ